MRSLPAKSLFVVTFALIIGLAGCASGGGGGDGAPRGSSTRIIAEELGPVMQLDVFDAIQRLRPNWLRSRGGASPAVLLDGTRQGGGVDALRSFRASDMQQMDYMSASDATNRYGTGYGGGAILLTTRR